MRLLLLGGTTFLGRATAAAALASGHEVTLFTRGRTNPDLFPEAEHLRGDRDGDLAALDGRRFDAVIDTTGYVPRVVRESAELLSPAAEHYTFVSSISVYRDFSQPVHEESPLAELGDDPVDQLTDDYSNYGALKALCEREAVEAFAGRALAVRAGLIVGPHDPTGRFTYWPHRVARGGEFVVPGPPDLYVQFVDARDLGAWLIDLLERRESGVFNATHPGISWTELVASCLRVTGSGGHPVWIDSDWLASQEVGEWMELPLWLHDPDLVGMMRADVSRALGAGLTFRPLDDVVRGTLELAKPTEGAGLTPERERALLEAWRS
jgi:nucleoside-diphosphate-sugar epimerase